MKTGALAFWLFCTATVATTALALPTGCGGEFTLQDAGSSPKPDAKTTTPTDNRRRFDAATSFEAGGDDGGDGGDGGDGAVCIYTLASPEVLPSPHVETGSPLTFGSNPPSSGPHYPIWAAFQEFTTPVPRGYYLHSEEHGAVILAYKCDSAGACPEIANALRALKDEFPPDPLCQTPVKNRIILTPDPLLTGQIAAAAWGFTYNADCLDLPSLRAFITQNYAHSPEDFCTNGQTEF